MRTDKTDEPRACALRASLRALSSSTAGVAAERRRQRRAGHPRLMRRAAGATRGRAPLPPRAKAASRRRSARRPTRMGKGRLHQRREKRAWWRASCLARIAMTRRRMNQTRSSTATAIVRPRSVDFVEGLRVASLCEARCSFHHARASFWDQGGSAARSKISARARALSGRSSRFLARHASTAASSAGGIPDRTNPGGTGAS